MLGKILKIKKEEKKPNIEVQYKGKKVLLVDDNKMNLKIAAMFLKTYDVDIDIALTGDECIDKIKNNGDYDLILLDDMMPDKDGIKTCQELKQLENFHVPIIILSANTETELEKKYQDVKVDGFLTKPFDKIELDEKLKQIFK